MNKTIRKNKYIAPKIIEFDMESTTILAGSGGPKYDTSENKIDFNSSESANGSWGGAKAPMRQNISDWSEEE
ncbi:unknown [Prevotella sp. CAG:520]|nr:unknown [Prevotella sp. CAG:520]